MDNFSAFSIKEVGQPIDVVEHALAVREHPYDRPCEDELVTEVLCSWCDLRVWCTWHAAKNMLLFSWGFGTKVPEYMRPTIHSLLALANEKIMLGHFDICSHEGIISFRHSMLLSGVAELSSAQVESLFDLAVRECERFYPALQSVLWAGKTPKEAVEAAMFDTVGQA